MFVLLLYSRKRAMAMKGNIMTTDYGILNIDGIQFKIFHQYKDQWNKAGWKIISPSGQYEYYLEGFSMNELKEFFKGYKHNW